MRTLAHAARVLARSCPPLAGLVLSAGAALAGDLLAVDREGHPVAGVRLLLADRPVGVLGADLGARVVTTGEDGRAALPDSFRAAHGIRSQSPEWAVAFFHGDERIDETYASDVLQRRPTVHDLSGTTAVVVEPTGTLELRIRGAGPEDRFHVCFLDQRLRPDAHLDFVSTHSFTGASARLALPPGRGNLYVARDGTLGTKATRAGGLLDIAITPGAVTRIDLVVEEGPEALLLAPFGTIPFAKLHALAPDGQTVVGAWDFERSPLTLPSSRVALDAPPSEAFAGRAPLRKHLLRAVDVPLQPPLSAPRSAADGTPERLVQPAPMELIFAIDVGGKLRLPETEGGWLLAARDGVMILEGPQDSAWRAALERRAPGELDWPTLVGPEGEWLNSWRCEVTTVDAQGDPAPFIEVEVSSLEPRSPGASPPLRAITDGEGRLWIAGHPASLLRVARRSHPGGHVTVIRDGKATLPPGPPRREVRGVWKRTPDGPPVTGTELVLGAPVHRHQNFGQGEAPVAVAIPDSDGRFRFEGVPPGTYALRCRGGGGQLGEVTPGDDALEILVVGEVGDLRISGAK